LGGCCGAAVQTHTILPGAVADRLFGVKGRRSAEVFAECTVKETLDSRLIPVLKEEGKIIIEPLMEMEEDRALAERFLADFKLGRGEAGALALALAHRRGLPLATDDRLAMRVARLLRIDFATAVHFLIEAYESSQIGREIALEKLNTLGKIGRYSERILADARGRLEGDRSEEGQHRHRTGRDRVAHRLRGLPPGV